MITVAGSVIADIFVRKLEREPARGSLTVVDQVGFHLGGAAPNTGAVLSRLGVPVSVVGRIGSDPFGSLVRQEIEKWASSVTLTVEAEAITGENEAETAATRLLKEGVRRFVAIKLGDQGAYIHPADGSGQYIQLGMQSETLRVLTRPYFLIPNSYFRLYSYLLRTN